MAGSPGAELISCSAVDSKCVSEWHEMAARAAEPNPWFEPHIVVPLSRIRSDITLLVARRNARMIACLPLIRTTRPWHGMPLTMWSTPHPMGTPLLDRDDGESALSSMFDLLAKERGPRFLTIQEIGASGPAIGSIARALADHDRSEIQSPTSDWPMLYRRPQPTYIEESLSPKRQRDVRRCRRLLEARLGGELRLVDRAGEAAALELFLKLEADGWKGRKGTALACDPLWADYFRTACNGFDGQGRLQILCLESEDTTVAIKVMTRAGEGMFELRAAYDERFARFSPGVLLEVLAIDHFHNGRDAWLMTNTNHQTSPLFRLWPDRCATTAVVTEWKGTARRAVMELPSLVRSRVQGRWRPTAHA